MSRAGSILAAAALSVGILTGCGGDDGERIPADEADAMITTVNQISEATENLPDDCATALASTTELRNQAEALPSSVDGEIEEALDGMISRVDEQLEAECADTGASDEERNTTEDTTTEEIVPTTPTTTTEEVVPEEEPEEEEPAPEEETEGNQGNGNGQGPPVTPPGQDDGGAAPPTGGTEEDG